MPALLLPHCLFALPHDTITPRFSPLANSANDLFQCPYRVSFSIVSAIYHLHQNLIVYKHYWPFKNNFHFITKKSKSRFAEKQYNHHCVGWLPPSTWATLCTLVNIPTLLAELSSANNLSVFLKYFPSTLKSNRSPRAM